MLKSDGCLDFKSDAYFYSLCPFGICPIQSKKSVDVKMVFWVRVCYSKCTGTYEVLLIARQIASEAVNTMVFNDV